jgi:hypothetical protein
MKRRGSSMAARALVLSSLVALPPSCGRDSTPRNDAPVDDPAAHPQAEPVRTGFGPTPGSEHAGSTCIDNGDGTTMRTKPSSGPPPEMRDH